YVPAATYTSLFAASPAVTAAATVALGWPKLPSAASLPPGATNRAAALLPSQFESLNARSGLSAAPGEHAAIAGVPPEQAIATATARASRNGLRCEIEHMPRSSGCRDARTRRVSRQIRGGKPTPPGRE